jgi:hypothetical protein
MKSLFFTICSALLFSTFTAGQVNPPHGKARAVEPSYQRATLLKMTARVSTQARETLRGLLLDTPITSQKTVTYEYTIRMGTQCYTCRYTPPDQPGEMPGAWWKGNAPVQARVEGHTIFIKQPNGIQVASEIVGQAADK